jgi:hypothetical protein
MELATAPDTDVVPAVSAMAWACAESENAVQRPAMKKIANSTISLREARFTSADMDSFPLRYRQTVEWREEAKQEDYQTRQDLDI